MTQEKEKLFLNTLSFDFPKQPIIFYFSSVDSTEHKVLNSITNYFPKTFSQFSPTLPTLTLFIHRLQYS